MKVKENNNIITIFNIINNVKHIYNSSYISNEDKNNFKNNSSINYNNNNNNYNYNNKGFTLLELSIVLIIIGLLVAGITAGSSLLRAAKLRVVINESITYRIAVNTFYSLYDRAPGSRVKWAAEELYDNGLIKEPKRGDGEVYNDSKFNGLGWYIESDYPNVNDIFKNSVDDLMLFASAAKSEKTGHLGVATDEIFSNADAKSIDEKVDDGSALSGSVLGVDGGWWYDKKTEYTNEKEPYAKFLVFKLDF